jgi:hypothetical protein
VDRYARRLFGTAAAANFTVGLSFLLLPRPLTSLLALDPLIGSNHFFYYLSASLIVLFGWAYLRIAQEPRRYRSLIEIGAIGKLLAVGTATWCWLAGELTPRLPLLISGDLVFAALFIDFLRRTRGA